MKASFKIPVEDINKKEHRHSAMAIYDGTFMEENDEEQKSMETKLRKTSIKSPLSPFQKTILKNPSHESLINSPNSLYKRNSVNSNLNTNGNKRESTSFPNHSLAIETKRKSQFNSGTFAPITLEQMLKVLESFEKAKNFKSYFPENNLNKIITSLKSPKKDRKSFQENLQKQKNLTSRLSKYTFFSEEMKQKMPESIMKRIRRSKNSKNSKAIHSRSKEASSTTILVNHHSQSLIRNDKRRRSGGFFKEKEEEKMTNFADLVGIVIERSKDLRKNK